MILSKGKHTQENVMSELVPRYIIGFLLGLVLGLIWPILASWWIISYLVAVFVISELVGRWGFGSHWNGYRFAQYLLYAFPWGIVALGILFGSGTIGSALVAVGKVIS